MNYQLAEAVIATFRTQDPKSHSGLLTKFSYRTWRETYKWLDASGLALYFLDRLQVLQIEAAIPALVLRRLHENAANNKAKTAHLFKEFMLINQEFRRAGLSYVNLKGFTLAPDAFRDAGLRLQLDLDFLIDRADIAKCQQVLEQQGYLLTGEGDNVKEFKAGVGQLPHLRDLYKSKLQRCVEIHFDESDGADGSVPRCDRLARLCLRRWEDLELPVLCDCDRFVALALHLFKHLKGEWTRASWILEYVNLVNFNERNEDLWVEVRQCALESEEVRLAIGVATLVSHQNFGIRDAPEVLTWTVRQLPQMVSLWLQEYGKEVVMASYPGTKNYLLLDRALAIDGIGEPYAISRILPFHRPARITVKGRSKNFLSTLCKVRDEGQYFFFGCTSILSRVAIT
jgi:hypothetical protein